MQRAAALTTYIIVLMAIIAVSAADLPYVGRWRVNEEKSDFGSTLSFSRNPAGELRFTQGDIDYVVHLDGAENPFPLGGFVSWRQRDDRTWETRLRKDGKVIGEATYTLSEDGQTMTSTPTNSQGSTLIYRRASNEKAGFVGVWSLKTATVPIMDIEVGDGYDLVVRSGGATCKANLDGNAYPTLGADGAPTTWSTCMIARTGPRSFSFTVSVNGRPFAVATRTLSEDGQTLTEIGGLIGQPPNSKIVYDRQ